MKNTPILHPDLPPPLLPRGMSLEPFGQRMLLVTEGSELRSLNGPLKILLYPGQPEAALPVHLQPGQGWRCPGTGWVSLHNPQATPCQAKWQGPEPVISDGATDASKPSATKHPEKSRPGLAAWGRLMGSGWTVLRPGRRAT